MMIAPAEQERLVELARSGKGLYVEGTNAVAYNSEGELLRVLGCTYVGPGGYQEEGNVKRVTGVPGTVADGFELGYLYQKEPDNYVEEIGPCTADDDEDVGCLRGLPAAAIFHSQDGKARVVCHAGPDGRYYTICSSVTFSALRGAKEELQKLAAAYVSFLCPERDK